MIERRPERPNPLRLCDDCGEHVAIGRVNFERVEFVCGYCARSWSLFAFPASGYKTFQEALDLYYLDEARRLHIPEGLRRRPTHQGYPGHVVVA